MKTLKPHENGPYIVIDGSLYNQYTQTLIAPYEMTMLMDMGCVLKMGKKETTSIYFEKLRQSQQTLFPNETPTVTLLEFTNFKDFNADEICTFVNYLNNHIPEEKIQELFQMDILNLKEKLQKLYKIGF